MVETVKLTNGVRVVLEKVPAVRSICFGIWVHNGSRHEDRQVNGISHFIEHMLFKGTDRHSARDIADRIDAVGGQINAFTSKEYTCYYTRTLDTHFDVALDVLADMFFNAKFDDEEIGKERNVILEEISMYEDAPEDLAHDLLQKNVWKNDSLGYPILGTKETIGTFTSETFKTYFSAHYHPQNTVLAVAGNFDRDEIIKALEGYFGHFARETVAEEITFQTAYQKSLIVKEKDIEQLHLILSFPGLGRGNKDSYVMTTLNTLLGGGMSSRLFQKIREENGLAYSVYSYVSTYQDAGLFSVYAGLNKNQCRAVIENIIGEIKNLYEIKITPEQLHNTKEQLKSGYLLSLESTSSRMNSIGKSELLLNKIRTPEEIIAEIDNVTLERLYQLIGQVLDLDNMSLSAVGNVEGLPFQQLIEDARALHAL